jgi:DNA-binding NtrC family response regulator
MAILVADRFLCTDRTSPAVDLATGDRVDLRIAQSGTRPEQQRWTDACSEAFADVRATLIDFGFIGSTRRFEAHSPPVRNASLSRPAIQEMIEWLDHDDPASAGILYRSDAGEQVLPLASEIRSSGFVPLNRSLVEHARLGRDIALAVAGRSVVLLDGQPHEPLLSLAFLALLGAKARDTRAIVILPEGTLQNGTQRPLVTQAAEGHADYGAHRSSRRFALRAGSLIGGTGAAEMLSGARRLAFKGRHAAAQRAVRAAMAAFDRRNDVLHAADAAMLLGELMMNRGRAGEAGPLFETARARFQKVSAAGPAVEACIHVGLAQTDLGLLGQADDTLRSARSAAAALRETGIQLAAGTALARNMFWQERYGDAASVLESMTPDGEAESCGRYWCMAARLRLAVRDLAGASRAVRRARAAIGDASEPRREAMVRTTEAAVQAKLGDVDALSFHVRMGIRAAGMAHQPLCALRLRLTLLEGLLDAGQAGRAHKLSSRLKAMTRMTLPPLLKARLVRAIERPSCAKVQEATPLFHSGGAINVSSADDVDGLTLLLSLCQEFEDEKEALNRAAVTIQGQTAALGVGIFGSTRNDAPPFATAGSVSSSLGRRCIDRGLPIQTERSAAGVEAATPIRYLGRVIGCVVTRWSVEGPCNVPRVMAFAAAAAAACAPIVYVRLERDSAGSREATDAGSDLIGVSPVIEEVRRLIGRAANAPFTVLIEGESGSGKELVARAVHRTGCRRERRFCALNCAALPEDLVDAELFGHAKGAFTGATIERLGLFESADGGTVFLDEVGELSPRAQAKLLRVLQEGEIRRIGENFTRPVDARLIAATNRSLRAEVEAGRFRQDLLYRLDVIRMAVPPLRERLEDIPLLAMRFWGQAAARIGSKAVLGPSALSALARYDWPGNVRELQNVLTALVVSVPARGIVGASELPAAIASATRRPAGETLETARLGFEQRFVRAALARAAGHRGQTAAALGVSRQGLAKLMQRLRIP